jgi:hypothetical protein
MIGDHIRTLKAGHWTHAIDCGDETVIVLAEAAEPPRVRRSYRPDFVAGADTVEVVRHRERTFPADEVVARAYSRISDPALASMFRDSEAFAEWCTTGRLPTAPQNVALSAPGVARALAPRSPPATRSAPAPAEATRKPAARARPAPKAARAKPARKAAKAKPARKAAKAKPARKAAKARPARKAAKRSAPRKAPKRRVARKGARRR